LTNFSNLKDLTIVVLTCDRPDFVIRQIGFWGGYECSLLIVDGSAEPNRTIGHAEQKNVSYLHSPNSFQERMLLAINHVNTEFVVLIPDDEFMIPAALDKFIGILKLDFELSSIQGRALSFWVSRGTFVCKNQYKKFRDFQFSKKIWKVRLYDFWSSENGYVVHYPVYSLMRSFQWKKLMSLVYEEKLNNAYAYEIKLNLLSPLFINSAVTNTLYWLRSEENPPNSSEFFDRSVRFSKWYLDPQNASDVREFLVGVFSSVKKLDLDILEEDLVLAVTNILDRYSLLESEKKLNVASTQGRFSRGFKRFRVRFETASLIAFKRCFNFSPAVYRLKRASVDVDSRELIKISELVQVFHNGI
jgi:glycosyltransferase domain-containing protein